jgi:class 3 adenylate cyclase
MPHNGETVSIRVGIHTGNCVSGLIGTRLPKFSIFGECYAMKSQQLMVDG